MQNINLISELHAILKVLWGKKGSYFNATSPTEQGKIPTIDFLKIKLFQICNLLVIQ